MSRLGVMMLWMIIGVLIGTFLYRIIEDREIKNIDIEEKSYENVREIYMYSPSEFCIHWGMSDKQVEVITCFSGVYSQVFTDVSVEKAMRVDHKKCDKTTAGCLEIHVHSLNDVLGLTRGK